MKKVDSQSKETALIVLYIAISAVMIYKIITVDSAAERILFLIPMIWCAFAIWSARLNGKFDRAWNDIHMRCLPEQAIDFLRKNPALLKKGRHASGVSLLYAYGLTDSGKYDEFWKYVTQDAKAVFEISDMKVKTDYLMFLNAFLQNNQEACDRLYSQLEMFRSAFETGENGSLSPAWRMVQGDYNILKGEYLKAEKAYGAIKEELLSTNREKAYYYYGLTRIALGNGNRNSARENLNLAKKYGSKIYAVKSMQISDAM